MSAHPHPVAGPLLLAAAAVAGVALSGAAHLSARADLAAAGEDGAVVTVHGTVRQVTALPGDRAVVALDVSGLVRGGVGGRAGGPVAVVGAGPAPDPGAVVSATGRASRPDPAESVVVAATPRVMVLPGAAHRLAARMRTALADATARLPEEPGALVVAVTTGDTARVSAGLTEAMRAAGLSHLTAVSGAHFSLLGAVTLAAAGAAGLPRRVRLLPVLAIGALLVVLVGAQPSVVRAAVMGTVGLLGVLVGRPARAVPALAASVTGLLVVDPWLAGRIGFALSVAATAGIVVLTEPVARRLRGVPGLRRALAVPVAAQVACAPLTVLLAPAVLPYAVLANAVVAPAVGPLTVLGLLAAAVGPWWPAAAGVLAAAAGVPAWWLAAVAHAVAGWPGARVAWVGGPAGAALLAVTLLAALRASRRVGGPWHP